MPRTTEEKLLQKRKFYVMFVVALMMVLLIMFNVGAWIFFKQIESYLETGLSRRLQEVAGLAARNIELTWHSSFTDPNQLIRGKLFDLQSQYGFESVYIITRDNRVVMDARNVFQFGDRLTYIEKDSVQLQQAWSGRVAVSPIHIVEGNRFRTAYAPLMDISLEIPSLLILEVNAEYFSILRLVRRWIIIGGVASLAAIVLFSTFLVWSINLFIRTHESLRKSEKLVMLGKMSASVAHEIRNPLGIIKATADVLKSKYQHEDTNDELFDYIGAEVHRLNNLVNDFLSFAREPSLNLNSDSLTATIEKAVRAFKREISEQNVSIDLHIDENIQQVKHDSEKIYQILLNLLMNAKQAIEGDGRITIRLQNAGVNVTVSVSDTGSGIEGDPKQIFEPFYTTKSTGSGLGLAISKQIIEKHAGWIDVESVLNQGTTIVVSLPKK